MRDGNDVKGAGKGRGGKWPCGKRRGERRGKRRQRCMVSIS
jgi:hypothetical protein